MDEPLAVALKFGFLAVLYLFLLWVARSAHRDLERYETASAVPAEPDVRRQTSNIRHQGSRLVVVAAMGHEPGTSFDVAGGATLGRADSSEIKVDDPYASSAHARVFSRGGYMFIEDMGSTNGTYLNNRQLAGPEQLNVGDTVRIGDTEYRYEE